MVGSCQGLEGQDKSSKKNDVIVLCPTRDLRLDATGKKSNGSRGGGMTELG